MRAGGDSWTRPYANTLIPWGQADEPLCRGSRRTSRRRRAHVEGKELSVATKRMAMRRPSELCHRTATGTLTEHAPVAHRDVQQNEWRRRAERGDEERVRRQPACGCVGAGLDQGVQVPQHMHLVQLT